MLTRRWIGIAAVCVALLGSECRAAAVRYRIDATLSAKPSAIAGTAEIELTNTSRTVLRDVVFIVFPHRFSEPDDDVNDVNRPFIYPKQDFDPGDMQIEMVEPAGEVTPVALGGLPDGTAVRIAIPATPPGGHRTLKVRFRTRVPYRFGSFGEFEQITLNGGWYPYLPPLNDDGTWHVGSAPPVADFEVSILMQPERAAVLNGFTQSGDRIHTSHHGRWLSLVAAPELHRVETQLGDTSSACSGDVGNSRCADGSLPLKKGGQEGFADPGDKSPSAPRFHRGTAEATTLEFLYRTHRFVSRISPEPDPVEQMRDALRDMLLRRPAGLPALPPRITVVEAPMRLNLAQDGDGMVLVSDRALRVNWLLRPFHEMQLAQALYADLLRPSLLEREPAADVDWVSEGFAHVLAARYVAQARPDTRSVQDWIELFNIFAIVDRFETEPKIPFVDTFFERTLRIDPRREQLVTFATERPPGYVVFAKLRQFIGDERFDAVVDRCIQSPLPFRDCAAQTSNTDLGAFFSQWLQGDPRINYRFGERHLNQPSDGGYRHEVTVRRDSTRPIVEPVEVQLRSIGGATTNLRWQGQGDEARLMATTSGRVYQTTIDPDRKLIETTRADNSRPPEPQLVLDTAEVEISSTEFGFSALAVARGRYDYRKDLAIAGVYTNRGIGAAVGPRIHFGPAIDANTFRHNLYGFYLLQALDASFNDERHPQVRSAGHTNGIGVRYDYNDIFGWDNPTDSRHLRLFADWYDRALGSDYNYVDWGASLVLTRPLWTPRTILAGEVTNHFSEPLGNSVVPLQGRYSLGGSRSIRGIGAEDEIGRNLFLIRTELRQSLYPETDHNFLDLLVARRVQARLFVDTGQVSNSAGAVYDPRGYAVGVGVGLGLVYDFLGFFPSLAYIEIATRVDRSDKLSDVQFLFGTRQAF